MQSSAGKIPEAGPLRGGPQAMARRPQGQGGLGLRLVREAEDGRPQAGLQQLAGGGYTGREVVEEIAPVVLMRRQWSQPQGGLGDDAQGAFGAGDELHQIRARGGRRRGGRGQQPAGIGQAQPLHPLLDLPVEGGLLPRGAGGDPAPHGGVLEGLREVAKGEAGGVQLALQLGAGDPCRHCRRSGLPVDAHDPGHLSQVQSEYWPFASGLDAAHDRRAATEGDNGDALAGRQLHHGRHLLLSPRPHHHVGGVGHLALPDAHQVLVPLPQAAHGPVRALRRDASIAHDAGEGRQHRRRQPRRPQLHPLQRVEASAGVRGAEARLDVRPEPLRVRQMVDLALFAPAPPLGRHPVLVRASNLSALHAAVHFLQVL